MSNQHSKCDDCYKTHLPEVHDRIILPSEAFGEGYVPDTNQASEEEQTKAIYEAMQIPYLSERHDAIKDLIRTEKLKLLAEVRERVVGEYMNVVNTGDTFKANYARGYNVSKVEMRTKLKGLEGEL